MKKITFGVDSKYGKEEGDYMVITILVALLIFVLVYVLVKFILGLVPTLASVAEVLGIVVGALAALIYVGAIR